MWWCSECNTLWEEGGFCSCGGKLVDERYQCPYCRKEVMLWDKFCGECGKPLQLVVKEELRRRKKEVEDED